MTSEVKTYIDFSDIVGIEITCPDCGSSATRTLEGMVDAAYVCVNCNVPLLPYNQTDARALLHFVGALRHVQGLKPKGVIRLNIKPQSIPQTSSDRQ